MTILFYIQPRTILRVKKGDTNYDTGTAGINQDFAGQTGIYNHPEYKSRVR